MLHTHGTWGRRIVTRETPYSLTTILYLKPMKRCSWHSHKRAWNQFYVISGELEIKTDICPGIQRNYTTIKEGQSFTVGPGVMHEFRTKDKITVIEEIAYVKYDSTDIHRELIGGDMVDEQKRRSDFQIPHGAVQRPVGPESV